VERLRNRNATKTQRPWQRAAKDSGDEEDGNGGSVATNVAGLLVLLANQP